MKKEIPQPLPILSWIKNNKLKTSKNSEIEFTDHAFLLDYIRDPAKRIVLRKCTQIGATFSTLIKLLYLTDKENLSIVYTLPTSGDVKDLVVSKFDPIIESSALLRAKVAKDIFSRRAVFSSVLKRIGGSHYFFRGSWAEHKAQTIDADVLVVDELDFQKPEVREMYEERLAGSSSKDILYWMGVPSLPNFGISELYDRSDQREWFIKCSGCSKLQTLEFPDNISFQKIAYVCKFCKAELSDDDRRTGKWVAKLPGREIHGYSINRLMAPWVSASKIIDDYHTKTAKHFYNFALGLPYLEKTNKFSREDFNNTLMSDLEFSDFKRERIVCGIDQGNYFHTILGFGNPSENIVTKAQVFKDAKDLNDFLDLIRPDLVVIDMFPDQHFAKGLQQKYSASNFILLNQRTWSSTIERLHDYMKVDRQHGLINIDRTEALDRMMERLKNKTLRILRSMTGLEELFIHFQNMIPDIEERFGRKQKVYKKIGKEDFVHATNYFSIGCELFFPYAGQGQRETIESSEVYLPAHKGSEQWLKESFERAMGRCSGMDTIIIPPKSNF